MYIDKENFEAWMERIMDRLDMQDKKIDRLLNSQNCLDGENIIRKTKCSCDLERNVLKRKTKRYRNTLFQKYFRPAYAGF